MAVYSIRSKARMHLYVGFSRYGYPCDAGKYLRAAERLPGGLP